jgi:tetratricopeptide (TPR) repeat protein
MMVLAQQLVTAPVDIAAVAAASPRPAACAPARMASRVGFTVWDRARSPEQQLFCARLAIGYAALGHDPSRAMAVAREADQQWPGQAAPLVLQARAALSMGEFARAHALFEQALKLDSSCLGDPSALHARARAAVATGQNETAARAYRKLAPRVGLMAGSVNRRNALVEAAVLAMHVGAPGLDEALGYLGEARSQPQVPGAEGYLLGALALALDRQGRVQEARGVAAEAGGPWGVARHVPLPGEEKTQGVRVRAELPLLPPSEAFALVAVLSEARYPSVARDYWQASVQAPDAAGTWRDHALRKLATVSGGR